MIKIKYRSLPKGFIYIVSKKEIKLFLQNLKNINFTIHYDGVSFAEQKQYRNENNKYKFESKTLWPGKLTFLKKQYSKEIFIDLWGIRIPNIVQNRSEIGLLLLLNIKSLLQSLPRYDSKVYFHLKQNIKTKKVILDEIQQWERI